MIWGIAEISGPYDLNEACAQGWAEITTETSFLDGLLELVTSGIYASQTVTIRCKSAPDAGAAAPSTPVAAVSHGRGAPVAHRRFTAGRLWRPRLASGMSCGVNDQSFPVTVLVKRPDGSVESVRVGTAVRAEDGFRLSLGELSIGLSADPAPSRASRESSAASGDRGAVFPPYGRSKGAPIAGASIGDLEYYINGSRRTLDDPGKARWHDKERALLAVMEAELARQRGGGGRGGSDGAPADDFEPPAHSDDDIPF